MCQAGLGEVWYATDLKAGGLSQITVQPVEKRLGGLARPDKLSSRIWAACAGTPRLRSWFPVLLGPSLSVASMLGPPKLRALDQPVTISLESLVPADHCYRHLDATLDLAFVREWVAELYKAGGRPSIDPVVF